MKVNCEGSLMSTQGMSIAFNRFQIWMCLILAFLQVKFSPSVFTALVCVPAQYLALSKTLWGLNQVSLREDPTDCMIQHIGRSLMYHFFLHPSAKASLFHAANKISWWSRYSPSRSPPQVAPWSCFCRAPLESIHCSVYQHYEFIVCLFININGWRCPES